MCSECIVCELQIKIELEKNDLPNEIIKLIITKYKPIVCRTDIQLYIEYHNIITNIDNNINKFNYMRTLTYIYGINIEQLLMKVDNIAIFHFNDTWSCLIDDVNSYLDMFYPQYKLYSKDHLEFLILIYICGMLEFESTIKFI